MGFLIFSIWSRGLTPCKIEQRVGIRVDACSRIGVCVSRGSSLTVMCPDDSTVSMMNLSVNPCIIDVMVMNIMTLIVTPAMHTSDWRMCVRR